MKLKIGTRSSALAIKQTEIFINHLKKYLSFEPEIIKIKTTGDIVTSKPLYEIGGKALFLKELEEGLLNQEIDIAVHSLKDVPGKIDPKFTLSCFIGREYPADAIISKKAKSLNELPYGSRVGTSSPRRIAFIKKARPDIDILGLRGNIDTRIRLLMEDRYDAIILAESGLKRLSMWDSAICTRLDINEFIPAVGQGIIVAEILTNNTNLNTLLKTSCPPENYPLISMERSFLEELSANCDTPVAAYITSQNDTYTGRFMYAKNLDSNPNTITRYLDEISEANGKKIAKELKLVT
ncbi:MAG: hydroxymethylbilane synthase [Rickettsiaceae bacterium]|nr:hydroxymethylbilane synthase [Rickettsiaceae bacterium]